MTQHGSGEAKIGFNGMCAGKKICQLLVQVISYPKWYGIKIFIQGFSVKSRFSILVQYYQQCRKRHLAFFVQILYGKIKKSKPCMNILMPYHFGQLMTCTKSWHIFFPGSNFIQTYFLLPSAVKGEQVINLLSVIPKKSKHYHNTLSQFPIHLAHCKHVSDLYPNLYPKIQVDYISF